VREKNEQEGEEFSLGTFSIFLLNDFGTPAIKLTYPLTLDHHPQAIHFPASQPYAYAGGQGADAMENEKKQKNKNKK
jgi:hypothetical protein